MDHFYEDICGFSQNDLFALYKKIVEKFPSGSHFVEVGSFLGKSASFMAVEIINSGKLIKLDCVDHWREPEEHRDTDEINIDKVNVKINKPIPVPILNQIINHIKY